MQITPVPAPPDARDTLMRKAQQLESAFLSEMLKLAAPAPEPGPFGGGIGESQMQSFLRDEQAARITATGGLGLADALYRALSRGLPDAG